MAKTSTNALTKRWAENQGWLCETVQRFYGGRRHDLFGIADSVIVAPGWLILAQNCSYGSLKAHRDAIDDDGLGSIKKRLLSTGATLMLLEWRRKKKKRGGKRIAREWWLRTQHIDRNGDWGLLSAWVGPLDLYPRLTKPERGEVRTWTKPSGVA